MVNLRKGIDKKMLSRYNKILSMTLRKSKMINQTDNNFLDISKLLSGELESLPFDLEEIPFPETGEEIAVSSLRFSGQVKDVSGFIRLIGTITGVHSAPCGRCLAPVARAFSIEIDLSVVTATTESDEDVILAEGQKIDLGTFVTETVLLNLPLRLLCREDCKGLCPKCGKDLNTGACECNHREIDPRLAGLADFFKDK